IDLVTVIAIEAKVCRYPRVPPVVLYDRIYEAVGQSRFDADMLDLPRQGLGRRAAMRQDQAKGRKKSAEDERARRMAQGVKHVDAMASKDRKNALPGITGMERMFIDLGAAFNRPRVVTTFAHHTILST